MINRVEVGSFGRLGDLNIGDRFDFLKQGSPARSSLALVKDIIPPHQESDPPDMERTVSIKFLHAPGLEIDISGMTTVKNFGKAPYRRITLAENSNTFPGFPNTRMPVSPLGMARSPIIPGVNFETD